MCILSVYTLLTVVSYYDLHVMSMSVMGFKNNLDGMFVSSIQFFGDFLNFFNFTKPLMNGELLCMTSRRRPSCA